MENILNDYTDRFGFASDGEIPSDGNGTLEASIGPLLTQHRNEAYLFTALEPVIYRIIPGSAVPFLKFDFGKYNVPESYWETENAMQAFTDLSQKGFISIAGFMMNDDYIVWNSISKPGWRIRVLLPIGHQGTA